MSSTLSSVDTAKDLSINCGSLAIPYRLSKCQNNHQHQQKQKQKQLEEHPHQHSSTVPFWLTIGALAIFSMLGNSFRVFLESLFGLSCASQKPSWLFTIANNLNLCVTSTQSIIFYDLPVNMIGCFVMGMFQPCQDIGLQSSVSIAFLRTGHWFQTSQVIHVAIRTGFCGSLTTFCAWNNDMLNLITSKQVVAAVFGYIIGTVLSVASLRFGQTISIFLHRLVNPTLADAEDLQYACQNLPINQNILREIYRKNRHLPDFDRRYLDGLLSEQELQLVAQQVHALDAMNQWKQTAEDNKIESIKPIADSQRSNTSSRRRRAISSLMNQSVLTMQENERKIIFERDDPRESVLRVAREQGWNVEELTRLAEQAIENGSFSQRLNEPSFVNNNNEIDNENIPQQHREVLPETYFLCSPSDITTKTVWCLLLHVLLAFSILGFTVYYSFRGSDNNFYRSCWISILLSPFGTLTRWYLSRFNGRLKGKWNWFPIGTFTANISASIVSGLVSGILIRYFNSTPSQGWSGQTILNAIKIGFAGSLSTVSTFVTEYDKIDKTFPHHGKALYYVTASLLAACILGGAVYAPLAVY